MKELSLILVLLITSFGSFELKAQIQEIDSLENLLQQHMQKDTVRVNLLNETAYKIYSVNIDKTLEYAEEAGELADKLGFAKGKAKSLKLLGVYYYVKANSLKALEYFQKSLKTYEDLGDKKGISACLNNIGNIYFVQGNYPKSLEYYKKALTVFKDLGNKKGISACSNNIGNIYSSQGAYSNAFEYYQISLKIYEELGDKRVFVACINNIGNIYNAQRDYPKALKYYQKSLKIEEGIGNTGGIAICFNNIGAIYKNKGDYPKALEYFQKSLKGYKDLGDKNGISGCFNNIGDVYQNQGNYPKALEYYKKSLKINIEIGNRPDETSSYLGLGFLYLKLKKLKEAYNYSKKATIMAEEIGDLELLKASSEILAKSSEALGLYKEAYKNYVVFKTINDSLYNEENVKKLTGLEYQYKFEKEKQAIELEQQKKDAVRTEKEKLQRIVRNSFIAGFILMALLVVIVLRSFLQKRKINLLLSTQKKEIENQNIEIQTQAEELRTTNKNLEESNATKDKFFSIIAHDLKSPFSGMLGMSEILVDDFDEFDISEQKEYIYMLSKSVRNTYELLENLLTWSRSQMGKVDFKPNQENIYLLTDKTIMLLSQLTEKKSIILENNISDKLFGLVDKDMFSTIMRNLVTNAIKYTPKGGEIGLSAQLISNKNKQTYIEISVRDNGIGISSELQSKLFSISKIHSTMGTENETGTGLGLVLCKEFVEKHGGEIWVKSETGKGSSFCFTIPYMPN